MSKYDGHFIAEGKAQKSKKSSEMKIKSLELLISRRRIAPTLKNEEWLFFRLQTSISHLGILLGVPLSVWTGALILPGLEVLHPSSHPAAQGCFVALGWGVQNGQDHRVMSKLCWGTQDTLSPATCSSGILPPVCLSQCSSDESHLRKRSGSY